ncbi:phosphatase PAP2 family protein [Aliidiomarina maris]|uniref:undecaprenyl-diphosphate phosphatase n=1 Tax=Aliidiomarina maris TaxID=531312 RepID=A0A327XBY4_9GAMM|nr:phosphatase PAP2 family protein [Aliidiomarina maris]MBA3988387.1 phosphatase PAP2 family protein [Idiomarina sp.]MCL5049128.1 phosphatase PAP2 family protein [Bacillota bacterium]RAK01796.1 undecaprenyl-diphosphatase [Aliidiomarina maris]RUO28608.1 phosphatase PAP2 family protein [Aliidiomarina maris]
MTNILKSIRRFDEFTFYWLFRFTRWWRDSRLAIWVSRSGDGPYYAALAGVMVAVAVEGSMIFLQRALIGFAIELPLYWWLKNTLRRARPALERLSFRPVITPADRFSFPSGHATAAFLFAGLAAVSFPAYALFFYVWASLVALSRVALGVHFPSDILAGALLGSLIAYFTLQLPIG